jgi:hypothetical protein
MFGRLMKFALPSRQSDAPSGVWRHAREAAHRWALKSLRQLLFLLPTRRRKQWRREIRDALALCNADVVCVSFPKSGRTWVRAMMTRLFQRHFGVDADVLLEFDNLHALDARIPRVLFTHEGDAWRRPGELDPDKSRYGGKPVILLVRDPIDVAVSRFFHVRNRARAIPSEEYRRMSIEQFVWAPLGGVPTIVRFLNQWHAALPSLSPVLVLRYEDLRSEPAASLTRLATFLGMSCSPEEIRDAVEFAAFENLRAIEERGALKTARLGARGPAGAGAHKVRRGKVGGYRDHFSAEDVCRLETFVRAELTPSFGYPEPPAAAVDAPDPQPTVVAAT